MSDLFGHDGRGNYYGIALVDPLQNNLTNNFDTILNDESPLKCGNLEIPEYSKAFLVCSTEEEARNHLGITPEMITPVPGPQGEQGPMGPAGPQGIQGPQGPQGNPGATGATGLTGAKGADGKPFTIDETLPQLSDLPPPTMELRGKLYLTEEFGRLHFCTGTEWKDYGQFTGVQGPAGPAGADGATGPVGPQGPKGDQGIQGIQGPKGDIGPQGATGPRGPAGPQGPAGTNGEDGVIDINALTVAELQNLDARLNALRPRTLWTYELPFYNFGEISTISVPVADSNLIMTLRPVTANYFSVGFSRANSETDAIYDVKYSGQFDAGLHNRVLTAQAFTSTFVEAYPVFYNASREIATISLFNRITHQWYLITMIANGTFNSDGCFVPIEIKKIMTNREES